MDEKKEVGDCVTVHKSGSRTVDFGKLVKTEQFQKDFAAVRRMVERGERRIVLKDGYSYHNNTMVAPGRQPAKAIGR